MEKFSEAQLEKAIIELFEAEGFEYVSGANIDRDLSEVLLKDDLKQYLNNQYGKENITTSEIDSIIRKLEVFPSSDIYESNKAIMKLVSDGFLLKREDRSQKDLYIQLIDYSGSASINVQEEELSTYAMAAEDRALYSTSQDNNIYKIVNQFDIVGYEKRIPDAIVYINGLPLVVMEFKSAIREESATINDAYVQLTTRYKRDIPELFKYNALCVISDGVNNKVGSFFCAL